MNQIVSTILTEDEQIADVLRRYWEQDDQAKFPHRVRDLASELGVQPHVLTDLVRKLTVATVEAWTCIECDSPVKVSSRTDYQQEISRRKWAGSATPCDACRAAARELEARKVADTDEEKRSKLRNSYSSQSLPSDNPRDYSLRQMVGFLAFVRLGMNEAYEWLSPAESLADPLAPSDEVLFQMLRDLHGSGLIRPHAGSAFSAFIWENNNPTRFYLSKVFWTVGTEPGAARQFVRRVEAAIQAETWPSSWLEESVELITEMLVEEALQYLEFVLGEHHFPFTPGEKTRLALQSVLHHHSLGQVYSMIWRKTKDAAAHYQRARISLQHAANTVPGGVQSFAERAVAQGWKIEPFSRNYKLPQSAFSQVLFDTALKLGSRMYSMTLNELNAAAESHNRRVGLFLQRLRAALDEPRHTGRQTIHALLTNPPLPPKSLERLADSVEEVTMGRLDWDVFVSEAEWIIDDIEVPRFI